MTAKSGTAQKQSTVSKPMLVNPVDRLMYSIENAAAALDLSRANLYRLIAAGEVRVSAVGGRRLIHRDDLIELADRMRAGEVKL